jgi:hypothetical protein
MSGYNPKTGVFSLTHSKASTWAGRSAPMDVYAQLLRDAGLEVLSVEPMYLTAKAKPSQIWEALSGRPSDPNRAAYHGE